MDYKTLYFHLFNVLSDAIEEIENGEVFEARDMLVKAQQQTEKMETDWDQMFNTPEDEARWNELGESVLTMPLDTEEDVKKLQEILNELDRIKPFPPFGVHESWERFKDQFKRYRSSSIKVLYS